MSILESIWQKQYVIPVLSFSLEDLQPLVIYSRRLESRTGSYRTERTPFEQEQLISYENIRYWDKKNPILN